MNELTRLQLKASELRSTLAKEEDAEKQDALVKEYGEVEREIRTQMVLNDDANQEGNQEEEDDQDGEEAEYRSLVERSNLSNYFDAVAKNKQVEGAEKELQEHHNLASNQVPLDMLETRAVTPAPSSGTATNQQPIERKPFGAEVANHLGIPMPRVAAGTPSYPDIATNATVAGPHTGSQSVNESTGGFNVVSIEPARYQASFYYRRTDAAKFPGMDAALRGNLSDALASKMDSEIITSLAADTTIAKSAEPTAVQSWSDLMKLLLYDRVDGIWAETAMSVRSVISPALYGLLAQAYLQNTVELSALSALQRQGGGARISPFLPAVASNKQTQIVRLGMRRDAVFPVWEGVTLINDEITRAKTGEIMITAVMLGAFKLLRADGFYLARTWHA